MTETYAIRFDFPEGVTAYAALHKGALGWGPLKNALLFDGNEAARRTLENGYGASAVWGRVITVKAGIPVSL